MEKFGKEILYVPGDGVCFIRSVQYCMKRDLDVRYSIDEILDKILDELYENAHKYKDYHTGSVRKLIEDSIKYLKETKYTLDIVDVVVGACANALKVNLYIFQRENDNCSLIPTYCCIPSNRDIFLKYDRAGGLHHGLDHYSAIADCPVTDTITNTPQTNSNEAKENQKVTTNSSNLKTKKNCMPNQKSDETETESNNGGRFNDQILSDLRDIYGEIGEEVSGLPGNNYIDLTDSDSSKLTNSNSNRKVSVTNTAEESDVDIISDPENIDEGVDIPEEYLREARPKKRKHLKTYINFAVFALMDSVHIEEIPWDVDGNQKYTIACEEGEYIDKYKDS